MFSPHLTAATTDTFQQLVGNDPGVVLVDFWAPWCGPCKMLAPGVNKLAEDYAGRVKFVTVNVDENGELGKQMALRSIPTFHVYQAGQRVLEANGALALNPVKAKLIELVD